MFSQDYIMRQIQQFIQVLNTILTQVLKIKQQNDSSDAVAYTNQMFKDEFGFNIDELTEILNEQGITFLKKEKGFTNDHLNILADILYELGEIGFDHPESHEQSLSMFTQSLLLYEFIEKDEMIYSIDRNLKMTKIKSYLS